jgi:tetratricopeptide (TPR) repeat protein
MFEARDILIVNKKILFLILCPLLVSSGLISAQGEKKYIRQGNHEYGKEKFSDSEISYRRAIDKNSASADAVFNAGDALYKQNKYEEAGKQFVENVNLNENNEKKSAALYNLGNSLLMANKVEESIDAYKGSLRLDPDNTEAKYNLAYAQDLLKQQQQQQKQQDKNKQNQDKKSKKNDQNKDQNNKQDQNQNEEKQNDKQEQQNQKQQQQEQPQQQEISKEDAERLLNAIANDEKDIQEKVKLAKAAKAKVRTVKNW